jgi:hypothetical protein
MRHCGPGNEREIEMRSVTGFMVVAAALVVASIAPNAAREARAFCGFYVASGDARLVNHASQVVLVRDGDRTVITMSSDFKGDAKNFAVVIPVPSVIHKEQVHIGEQAVIDHLAAYSAPRLVEYFDPDPCPSTQNLSAPASGGLWGARKMSAVSERGGRVDEVRIEARYTVGEYDILILSADESAGLARWLTRNGYRIPAGATPVLGSYLKQGMKFFVAKVNLGEQQRLGFNTLRPISVAYETPKFMLPIRLGMANADGAQDMLIYTLTRNGRVECVNYRTVKLPTDIDVPEYVKDQFSSVYDATFAQQTRHEGIGAVFTEYAWDMGWCDPCASQPLTPQELRQLGVFWGTDPNDPSRSGQGQTFVTRLHVRYDRAHFPEDLVFQQTADRANWQARYVMHHPWKGDPSCIAGRDYVASLPERRKKEAQNLATLTGWSMTDIKSAMAVNSDWSLPQEHDKWYERMWGTSTSK